MKDVISWTLEDFAILPLMLIRAPVSIPCILKWQLSFIVSILLLYVDVDSVTLWL